MKIHFVSFYGVDFDMDLLPYWCHWYRDRKFDSYTVFLHRYPDKVLEYDIEAFRLHGFDVRIAPCKPYTDGHIQKTILSPFASSLPQEDFLVVADADEFQCSPESILPINYRKALKEYDMLFGGLCDFYGNSLEECLTDPFLQYPHMEPNEGALQSSFTPPWMPGADAQALPGCLTWSMKKDNPWPATRRTKILAARCGAGVDFSGSHGTLEGSTNIKVDFGYRVAHCPWIASVTKKMLAKSYYDTALCGRVGAGNEETLRERERLLREINSVPIGRMV